MKRILTVIGVAVWIGGCQTAPLLVGSSDRSDASVMKLWKTYNHCRTTKDITAMEVDARELNLAAQHFSVPKPSPILLPAVLKKHVVEQRPRFSVDPNAMSASCSLYAGRAALRAGRVDVAREMFRHVLQCPSGADYSYYLKQARAGLREIDITILVSGPKPSQLIPVSATRTTAEGLQPRATLQAIK